MSNILSPNLEKYGHHGIRRKNGVILPLFIKYKEELP
jgi:hypothetical protein